MATLLREWIPSVLQSVEPFISSESIDKGSRWGAELSSALEVSTFGIVCLTRENVASPWVTFEAGALSRGIEKGNVCPLLIDLAPADLIGPL